MTKVVYYVIWIPPTGPLQHAPETSLSAAIRNAKVTVTQQGGIAVIERHEGRESTTVRRYERDAGGIARNVL
jgi:hypothetical protein